MSPIILLLPLAAGAIGVAVILLILFAKGRGAPDSEPTCSACGYGVRGISGLNCPECGADLREIGITTRYNRRRAGPVIAIVLWTLILPLPAALVMMVASITIIPMQNYHEESYDFFTASAEHRFSYEANNRQLHWPWQDGTTLRRVQAVTIRWNRGDDSEARIEADLSEETTHLFDAEGRRIATVGPEESITDQVVLDWLAAGGMSPTAPQTQAVAVDLTALARESRGVNYGNVRTTALSRRGGSFTGGRRMPLVSVVGPIVFWVTIWLIGCIWLYRRYRLPAVRTE